MIIRILLGLGLVLLAGCEGFLGEPTSPPQTTLTISGSETMSELAHAWSENFMELNDGITVTIESGGSGGGIDSMTWGKCDIAKASRAMTGREISRLQERRVTEPGIHVVAVDRIAVFLNPNNPITSLTVDQLSKIFSGSITNWNKLGGSDGEIQVFIRDRKSGTRVFFQNNFMDSKPFAESATIAESSEEMNRSVGADLLAIGFGSAAASEGVRIAPIMSRGKAWTPEIENVVSGNYQLVRPLFLFTVGEAEGLAKEFIDFATSEKGREIATATGFCPPSQK
jgi:phosphate transport system substrate-binding protein